MKLSWRKDDTFKMTLQYKYDDQALWTGLELYGLLSSCFLLYSFILTAVISAVGRRIIRIIFEKVDLDDSKKIRESNGI